MIELSSDPKVAEQQIEAIIFYLTTCGYIDSEFDLSENLLRPPPRPSGQNPTDQLPVDVREPEIPPGVTECQLLVIQP